MYPGTVEVSPTNDDAGMSLSVGIVSKFVRPEISLYQAKLANQFPFTR